MTKKVVITLISILVLFCSFSAVQAVSPIEALKNEIQRMEKSPNIDDFERWWKLNEILREMVIQERDRAIIQEWEENQRKQPCKSLDRDTLFKYDCVKVVM